MKKKWQIKDLIDLEYFLHDDERRPYIADEPHPDRNIYLKNIKPIIEKENAAGSSHLREDIIRLWLDHRRRMAKTSQGPEEAVLPGAAFEEVYTVLLYAIVAIGFVSGAGLAFSLLTYHGSKPLNVTVYLGIFVIGQAGLIFGLILFSFLRRYIKIFSEISMVYRFIGLMLTRIIFGFKDKVLKNFPEENRINLRAAIGLVKGKKAVYGSAFYWPIFILAQAAGVGFNLGVLVATMLRVASRDLAFGWESTIQLGSQTVYDMVRMMALPWSWFVSPPIAHPTLAQIEGSRIILKEGIYHLSTQNLVSWWPFLCLAVFFYGLLPRMILLGAGRMAQTRAISRLNFYHSSCEKLMIRMTTPALRTKGLINGDGRRIVLKDTPGDHNSLPRIRGKGEEGRGAVVLVPDDIFGQSPESELADRTRRLFGFTFLKRIKIGIDSEADMTFIKALSGIKGETHPPAVLLLQEAWQPPIKETGLFIREVRKILGPQAPMIIALIGKPGLNTIFTKVEDENWKMWEQEIAGMGDPGIWPAKFGDE